MYLSWKGKPTYVKVRKITTTLTYQTEVYQNMNPNPILIIKTHILTPERHTNNFESLDKNSVRIVEARVVKLYSTLIEAFKEAC